MLHQPNLFAGPQPECLIVTVTPLIARTLLGDAGMALPANPALLAAYAADMATGLWKLNGVPVVIGRDARVLDGIKRLRAAAEYGVPFPTLLITGIDPAVARLDRRRRHAGGGAGRRQGQGTDRGGPAGAVTCG